MKYKLPPKAKDLLDKYLTIQIGKHKINCPYYRNTREAKGPAVAVGKGSPEEIKKHTIELLGIKRINQMNPFELKLNMSMSGLGVDCSGLTVRILNSILNEKLQTSIKNVIKPKNLNPICMVKIKLKPFTNISADTLTNNKNVSCVTINNCLPGDLIRIGAKHVAIICQVERLNGKTQKIIYAHSTTDYYEKYGVKLGTIAIINSLKNLEYQKWEETYNNENFFLDDYLSAKKLNRGIKRLNILFKQPF